MRLILIEDDHMIAESLMAALKEASYTVDHIADGRLGLNAVTNENYDLVLLDLGLPSMDGFEVLQSIRAQKIDIPIIVITARDAVENRIKGLNLGADDYIVKPFDLDEALARISALIRRYQGRSDNLFTLGKLTINLSEKSVLYNSSSISLSAKEYALLVVFTGKPGAIFSREELEDKLYGWGEEVESNAIEYLIHALRKKTDKTFIKNVRGLGWYLNAE